MTDGIAHSSLANGADTAGRAVIAGTLAAVLLDPAAERELRRRVEATTESLSAIAAGFGVPRSTFARHVSEQGWQRPAGAPRRRGGTRPGARNLAENLADAPRVSGRLLRAVDRQVGKIESRMRKRDAEIAENDARILGHLARTLATLMALDRDDGATAKEPEPVDRDELNAELARRIARWAEGGEEPA